MNDKNEEELTKLVLSSMGEIDPQKRLERGKHQFRLHLLFLACYIF